MLGELNARAAGLASADAADRLARIGPNEVRGERRRALLTQWFAKFRNPLVLILLAASLLSAVTGDVASFVIITTIVAASVTLDFVQEYRAGAAAEQLRRTVAVRARVLRDGQAAMLAQADLVPGDVVLLSAGDLVPADCRVLAADDFFIDQALLSGESYPVEKAPAELDPETELMAATNAVLLGSSVVSGSATVLVCRTGAATELGAISGTLRRRRRRPASNRASAVSACSSCA